MQNVFLPYYVYLAPISQFASYFAYCVYNAGGVFLMVDAACSHPASHISDSVAIHVP